MDQLDVYCPCGGGKKFLACHGAAPAPQVISAPEPEIKPSVAVEPAHAPRELKAALIAQGADQPVIVAAPPAVTRKLDLACGQNKREGFEGVDLWKGADLVVDLTKYPWPFEDNSVAEIHCSHYIEHIAAQTLRAENIQFDKDRIYTYVGKDALFAFFDECHRILVPDGWMTVITPCARSNRAFQDPTHRRFIVAETFLYLSADWRKINKLDHYNVSCDFGVNVDSTIPQEMTLLHPAAQQRRFNHEWNTVADWVAKLQAKKPGEPPARTA